MALTLTPDQAAQIDPKRVSDDKLPQIFNRATGQDQPISRDFEAVLITMDRQTKQSAVSWAQALADFEPEQAELRTVIAQFLDNEYDSLASRVSDAFDGLGDLDGVKSGLAKITLQGAQGVPEIATLISDLDAMLGAHLEKGDRGVNGLIVNRALYARQVEGSDMTGISQELRSFVPSLLAY